MEESKAKTKTEEFKVFLQTKVSEVLGVKVSQKKAWDLFKEIEKSPYSFILAEWEKAGKPAITYGAKPKELALPLAGVGTFKVITTGKEDNFSVKGRYYLSSALDNAIRERLGFKAEEADDAVEAVEAAAPAEESFADGLDLDL